MTRRDIVFIAVLANIAVLVILFLLAFRTDEEPTVEKTETRYAVAEEALPQYKQEPIEFEIVKSSPSDEVDSLLEDITPIAKSTDTYNLDDENSDEPIPPIRNPRPQEPTPGKPQKDNKKTDEKHVEITVKSGDALEKIARANGTSVDAIMRLNGLKTDKLKIGQVLTVPQGSKRTELPKPPLPKPVAINENGLYTMKAGDSLWKIAKQNGVKVDDLLRLNDLDEEAARRLKTGDQIRLR